MKNKKSYPIISVTNAEYISRYNIKVSFSDGTSQVIDFGKFLRKDTHSTNNKYRAVELFKKFRIDGDNLVWGENWDLGFHKLSLYYNDLFGNYDY